MKQLSSHRIGIDSGDVVLFKDYEDGGEMWTGTGQRERRRRVEFSEPFHSRPTVQVSLSLWDVDASTIMRADISADSVSKSGFDLVFRTWGDTKVARVRMAWTAIGELSDEDHWDVH